MACSDGLICRMQAINQCEHVALQLRQRFIGQGELTVIDMPEFNLFDASGEFSFQHEQMLSAIDRYNVMGVCQITITESERRPHFHFKCDTTCGEARHRILRDRPDIVYPELKRKAARDGVPVKINLRGKMIEQKLRKAAAVVVAGAKEQHGLRFHDVVVSHQIFARWRG